MAMLVALRLGIYPPLFTSPSGDSCILLVHGYTVCPTSYGCMGEGEVAISGREEKELHLA